MKIAKCILSGETWDYCICYMSKMSVQWKIESQNDYILPKWSLMHVVPPFKIFQSHLTTSWSKRQANEMIQQMIQNKKRKLLFHCSFELNYRLGLSAIIL